MSNNPLTDEKKLVEHIAVQNFWVIFNRVYKAEDGFSLELFRGRTYLGSILSSDITSNSKARYQRFGLRNNDTILRINLGYRRLDVKCQLPMRDGGWVRSYEGIMKIAVSNPYLFALQYQQESDPVALAQLAIVDAIKRYAQRTNHDDISDNTLRYEARIALSQGAHKNYGLTVVEVLASNIYLDPKRAEILSITHEGEVTGTRIRVDADNTFAKARRDVQLEGFIRAKQRDEDVVQRQHDRQQAFLDAASEGLKQNMLREISEGVPPEILARRYPQFTQLLGFPAAGGALPPAQEQYLLNKAAGNPAAEAYSDPDVVTGNYTIVPQQPTPIPATAQPASAPQPFYSASIGVWLVHTPLSDKQRQAWGVSNQAAFMVYALDPDSVAERGYMMLSDMLIEVNDQPVQSVNVLLNALDGNQPGTKLLVRVLRGGQPYELELDML